MGIYVLMRNHSVDYLFISENLCEIASYSFYKMFYIQCAFLWVTTVNRNDINCIDVNCIRYKSSIPMKDDMTKIENVDYSRLFSTQSDLTYCSNRIPFYFEFARRKKTHCKNPCVITLAGSSKKTTNLRFLSFTFEIIFSHFSFSSFVSAKPAKRTRL